MNKMIKISMLLMMAVLSFAVVFTANAETTGTCGTNVSYTLSDDGVLTISGTGTMSNFTSNSKIPWYSNRNTITKIVIEDGVTSIGTRAFYNCSNLSEISLPAGLTDIGQRAFYGCESLIETEIPDTVEIIDRYAFAGCASLEAIVLSDSLAEIGDYAFEECASLTEITIPDSVEALGEEIFGGCSEEFKIIMNYSSFAYEFFSELDYTCEVWCEINIVSDSEVVSSDKIILGESYTFPAKPDIEKEGYYFAGWSFNDKLFSAGKKITVESDINAEALWNMITYKINFECKTGTNPTPAVKKYWEPLTLDFIPAKDGFEFKGWAISEDSSEVVYEVGSSFEENRDTILYAVWSELTYIVAYSIPESESVIPAQIKKHTEKLQLSDMLPIREGYTFTGWSTKEEAVLPEYKPGGLFDINEDTILYAVWKNGIIAGDADNNGTVEMTDLMIMMKRINNHKLTLTVDNIVAMDVHKDTYFNIKDLLKMAQFLSGWNNVVLGE